MTQQPNEAITPRPRVSAMLDIPEPPNVADYAKRCEDKLIVNDPNKFEFPTECGGSSLSWPAEAITQMNGTLLSSLRGRGNVYAIFIRDTDDSSGSAESKWQVVYVGQRNSLDLRERIRQHLIKKSEQTSSVLDKVKDAVSSGKEIGLSIIKVEPELLRLYVEATIINRRKAELIWNTHGRR